MTNDIFDISGNTPLVPMKQLTRQKKARFMAKLEYMNPCMSHYCRVSTAIVKEAEEEGLIHPGMTLVDWTFGTSGIALAMVAVSKGYKVLLAAPDSICREKQEVLKALGAELVLTPVDASGGNPVSYTHLTLPTN